jgi:hypothetical protein
MIRMHVRHEDRFHGEARGVAHHLPLRALSAVEEEHIPFPLDGKRAHVPAHGGPGGGGAEEGQADHERR